MVRRFRPRRRRFGRRNKSSFMTKAGRVASMALSAVKGVSYIKSLINVEKKKHYSGLALQPVPLASLATAHNLSAIAEGPNLDQRNGISILAQNLLFRGQIVRAVENTAIANFVRVMLVLDYQYRDTDPTLDTIINNTSSNYSIITPLDQYINGRFKILMDKTYTLTADKPTAIIEYYKNFGRKFHIKYQGTTAADGALNKNQLMVFYWTTSSSNPPTITWNSRLSYTDN